MTDKQMHTFEELYSKDIKKYVEKLKKTWTDKQTNEKKSYELSYLSWAYGWREMKRIDPEGSEKIHEFPLVSNGTVIVGVTVPYLQTPQGFFVKNTVTINGRSETEILPVLDNSNKPIANPTTFQINTSNKRCFVKALAKHGLGLYLYVGEDIPEDIVPAELATKEQLGMLSVILENVVELTNTDIEVLEANLVQKNNISSKLDELTKDEYGIALNYANHLKIKAEKRNKLKESNSILATKNDDVEWGKIK